MNDSRSTPASLVGILILGAEQSGYRTDALRYTRELGPGYTVTEVCWNYGLERHDAGAAEVVCVDRRGTKPARVARPLEALTDVRERGA